MEDKSTANQQGQSEANTSTTPEGGTLLQRLKAKGYNTDKVGQGFVMHLPRPKRETQGTQA
jgi:hypothetical protein